MQEQTFYSIQPQHPLITKYIDYYYFQETFGDDYETTYRYYPYYGSCINVYLNCSLSWDDSQRILKGGKEGMAHCVATTNQLKSRVVRMYGETKKLGIIFKPLGLNHFIDGSLSDLEIDTVGYFDRFNPHFVPLTQKLFKEESLRERALALDHFLQRYFRVFEEQRVQKALDLIFEYRGEMNVNQIADKLNMNRKTLLRLFKKHMTYTVKDYNAVVKFRLAFKQYLQNRGRFKMSDIAFDNGYYDQAHFAHQFQSIAGTSPTELFKSIREVTKNGLYWTFPKVE